MKPASVTRKEACELINRWSNEAENGNYHDLAKILYSMIDIVNEQEIPGRYFFIKSTDGYEPLSNIVILDIND